MSKMFTSHLSLTETSSRGMMAARGLVRTLAIATIAAFSLLISPLSAQATPAPTDACPTAGVRVNHPTTGLQGSTSPYSIPSNAPTAVDVSGSLPFCGGVTPWRSEGGQIYTGYVSYPALPSGASYFDGSGNINLTLMGTPAALGFRIKVLDPTTKLQVGIVALNGVTTDYFQWTTGGQPASGEYTVTGVVSGIVSPNNINTNGLIFEVTGLGASAGVSGYDEIRTFTVQRYGTGVTFDANGGTGADRVQAGSTSAPLTANTFARTGFAFSGWATSPSGSVVYADEASFDFSGSAQTLFAQWVALPAVTFSANGGSGTGVVQYGSGSGALTASPFTRAGFTFSGWNTESDGTGDPYSDEANFNFANGSDTLYAQWTAVTIPSQNQSNGIESGVPTAPTLAATGANVASSGWVALTGMSLLLGGLIFFRLRRSL